MNRLHEVNRCAVTAAVQYLLQTEGKPTDPEALAPFSTETRHRAAEVLQGMEGLGDVPNKVAGFLMTN